ncbi:unnamed protein product [Closterium sp. NIES-64]|nr:unnamed protein product [Closterium sp. NIES-64]
MSRRVVAASASGDSRSRSPSARSSAQGVQSAQGAQSAQSGPPAAGTPLLGGLGRNGERTEVYPRAAFVGECAERQVPPEQTEMEEVIGASGAGGGGRNGGTPSETLARITALYGARQLATDAPRLLQSTSAHGDEIATAAAAEEAEVRGRFGEEGAEGAEGAESGTYEGLLEAVIRARPAPAEAQEGGGSGATCTRGGAAEKGGIRLAEIAPWGNSASTEASLAELEASISALQASLLLQQQQHQPQRKEQPAQPQQEGKKREDGASGEWYSAQVDSKGNDRAELFGETLDSEMKTSLVGGTNSQNGKSRLSSQFPVPNSQSEGGNFDPQFESVTLRTFAAWSDVHCGAFAGGGARGNAAAETAQPAETAVAARPLRLLSAVDPNQEAMVALAASAPPPVDDNVRGDVAEAARPFRSRLLSAVDPNQEAMVALAASTSPPGAPLAIPLLQPNPFPASFGAASAALRARKSGSESAARAAADTSAAADPHTSSLSPSSTAVLGALPALQPSNQSPGCASTALPSPHLLPTFTLQRPSRPSAQVQRSEGCTVCGAQGVDVKVAMGTMGLACFTCLAFTKPAFAEPDSAEGVPAEAVFAEAISAVAITDPSLWTSFAGSAAAEPQPNKQVQQKELEEVGILEREMLPLPWEQGGCSGGSTVYSSSGIGRPILGASAAAGSAAPAAPISPADALVSASGGASRGAGVAAAGKAPSTAAAAAAAAFTTAGGTSAASLEGFVAPTVPAAAGPLTSPMTAPLSTPSNPLQLPSSAGFRATSQADRILAVADLGLVGLGQTSKSALVLVPGLAASSGSLSDSEKL